MSYATVSIDPGTTPTVQVATDTIGSAIYQRVKAANPNADMTGAYGVDTDPIRTRNRRRGTNDFDTGVVLVPAGGVYTSMFTSVVYPEGGFATNLTDINQWISIANTAGTEIVSRLPLGPRETRLLPFGAGCSFTGLKWQAENVSAVNAHMWGAV